MTHQPDAQEWEKGFLDFYFERNGYEGRKLGPDGYMDFIRSQIEKARKEERERIREKLQEYKDKGFEIETALYSALLPTLDEFTNNNDKE